MMVATVDSGTAAPAQIPGVRGRRQDRHRAVHGRPAALRLVRLLRPGRRPAGGRRRAGAVQRHLAAEIGGGRLGGPIAKAIMEAVINQ